MKITHLLLSIPQFEFLLHCDNAVLQALPKNMEKTKKRFEKIIQKSLKHVCTNMYACMFSDLYRNMFQRRVFPPADGNTFLNKPRGSFEELQLLTNANSRILANFNALEITPF